MSSILIGGSVFLRNFSSFIGRGNVFVVCSRFWMIWNGFAVSMRPEGLISPRLTRRTVTDATLLSVDEPLLLRNYSMNKEKKVVGVGKPDLKEYHRNAERIKLQIVLHSNS
jgi:hypothetical protein